MGEEIDQFCEDLRTKLTVIENHLTTVGDSIKAAPSEAKEAISAKIDAAKTMHAQNMQVIADTKGKLEARVQERKSEIASEIQEWKTNRETEKLEHRAKKAENYAIFAIEFAAAATAEADLAVLEAIAARRETKEV